MTRPKIAPGPYVQRAPGQLLVLRESRRRLPTGVRASALYQVESYSPHKPWLMCRMYPLLTSHYVRQGAGPNRYYAGTPDGLDLVHPVHVLRTATPQETALFREAHS